MRLAPEPVRPILLVCAVLTLHLLPAAQLVTVPVVPIPAADLQLDGPFHDYALGVHEITNGQFATFLNDAELHNEVQNPGGGDEKGDAL